MNSFKGSSLCQGVQIAEFKKVNFSASIWEEYTKSNTHFDSDAVEGMMKCSGLCNKRGSQCSMFKFSKEDGTCSTAKDDPSVDCSIGGEENMEIFVRKGLKIGIEYFFHI